MARKIHSRYKISGDLIAKSPIHVGGLGSNVDTDLALAVNGKGQYYIPGTSLAGALRNWMEIIAPVATNYLWGYQDLNSDQGHASFILVEDGVIELSGKIAEIRDNVAIDRQWGTAVDQMKFDRMILPRGVKVPLEITLERPYEREKDAKLSDEEWIYYQSKISQLLHALTIGQISIGAAKTRGLGRVKLENLTVTEQVLHNQKGILNLLKDNSSQIDWSDLLSQANSSKQGKLEIEIHWKPVNPVMVKAEAEGIAVDILPLISGFDGGITFVLPGSSIKGSLRTQAERIIRTVLQKETPRIDDNLNKTFNDQIDLHLVKTLFGSPAKLDSTKTDSKEPSKPLQLGYLGALSVDDCFADEISLNHWSEVENATNEENLRIALNKNELNYSQQAFHVAIDRWTGGAADGYLYTVLEPMGVNWFPLNLSLDLHRLNRDSGKQVIIFTTLLLIQSRLYRLGLLLLYGQEYYPCFIVLLLTLRDLINERIPLGFGTNRGMGAISVTKIQFKAVGNVNGLNSLESLTLTKSDLSELDSNFLDKLQKDWQKWINKNRQEVLSNG